MSINIDPDTILPYTIATIARSKLLDEGRRSDPNLRRLLGSTLEYNAMSKIIYQTAWDEDGDREEPGEGDQDGGRVVDGKGRGRGYESIGFGFEGDVVVEEDEGDERQYAGVVGMGHATEVDVQVGQVEEVEVAVEKGELDLGTRTAEDEVFDGDDDDDGKDEGDHDGYDANSNDKEEDVLPSADLLEDEPEPVENICVLRPPKTAQINHCRVDSTDTKYYGRKESSNYWRFLASGSVMFIQPGLGIQELTR